MKKEIHSLIKALERQYGCPVQISVETPKETEQVLENRYNKIILPTQRTVYGSLQKRPCQVLPLPTDVHEIKHDLDLIAGNYDSLCQLNEKINKIERLEFLCFHGSHFDEGLRNHLTTKYEVKEKEVGIAHGGVADWYTVDGVEADLGDWERKRPDLFDESCRYLEENKVPFRYHNLVATPHGLYIAKRDPGGDVYGDGLEHYFGDIMFDAIHLEQKIADLKLELLK